MQRLASMGWVIGSVAAAFVFAVGCEPAEEEVVFPPATGGAATGGATSTGGTATGGTTTGGTPGTGGDGGGGADGNATLLPVSGFIEDWDGTGIMGAWYTFYSPGSSGTPAEGAAVAAADGKTCFSGTAAQVLDDDYATYYGATIGFDLCAAPADPSFLPEPMNTWTPESKHLAPECGISLETYSVTIEGPVVPSALRMVIKEQDRDESVFVTVGAGVNTGEIADATVAYDAAAPVLDPTRVEAIHFQIATNVTAPTPFDFCITALSIE